MPARANDVGPERHVRRVSQDDSRNGGAVVGAFAAGAREPCSRPFDKCCPGQTNCADRWSLRHACGLVGRAAGATGVPTTRPARGNVEGTGPRGVEVIPCLETTTAVSARASDGPPLGAAGRIHSAACPKGGATFHLSPRPSTTPFRALQATVATLHRALRGRLRTRYPGRSPSPRRPAGTGSVKLAPGRAGRIRRHPASGAKARSSAEAGSPAAPVPSRA
jgi:hypothetical protein